MAVKSEALIPPDVPGPVDLWRSTKYESKHSNASLGATCPCRPRPRILPHVRSVSPVLKGRLCNLLGDSVALRPCDGPLAALHQSGRAKKKQCDINRTPVQIVPVLAILFIGHSVTFQGFLSGEPRSWVSCFAASCDGVMLSAI